MLHARPAVELQVLLDLRPPPALGRLVDRELDPPRAVLHHLRHQGRVLGADVLVVEVDELREAEHVLVEPHPLVHLAFLDVADDVVDRLQADRVERARAVAVRVERLVAGGEDAAVAVAVDEAVRRVAVGADGGVLVDAVLVLAAASGGVTPTAPAADGRLVGRRDVVHFEGDVLHAVAVGRQAGVVGVVGAQRRGQDEGDLALPEDVAGLVPQPRLQAGVGDHVEAEGVAVEVGRLAGVADEEADVVDASKGHLGGWHARTPPTIRGAGEATWMSHRAGSGGPRPARPRSRRWHRGPRGRPGRTWSREKPASK